MQTLALEEEKWREGPLELGGRTRVGGGGVARRAVGAGRGMVWEGRTEDVERGTGRRPVVMCRGGYDCSRGGGVECGEDVSEEVCGFSLHTSGTQKVGSRGKKLYWKQWSNIRERPNTYG